MSKTLHLFTWWMHLEEAGNDIPYEASFATWDDLTAYLLTRDPYKGNLKGQVFQTQTDGSLKLTHYGGNSKGEWKWIEYADTH